MSKQKIKTCLWFEKDADKAAEYYVSLFKGARVTQVARYPEEMAGMRKGDVMTVDFEIGGAEFMLLNAGPHFKQSEAASIFVLCDDQAEVDRLWDALTSNGGQPSQCGWLKDRWGVSWQIIPRGFMELTTDPDRAKAARAMQAMMGMQKLDLAAARKAHGGGK